MSRNVAARKLAPKAKRTPALTAKARQKNAAANERRRFEKEQTRKVAKAVLRRPPRRKRNVALDERKVLGALLASFQTAYSRFTTFHRYLPFERMVNEIDKAAAMTLPQVAKAARVPAENANAALNKLIRFAYVGVYRTEHGGIKYVILTTL